MTGLEAVFKQYAVSFEKKEIQLLLTHNSYSEKNNSRYVFLGQYYFRGKLSHWVFKNISGTGTQLQHYLGNIFSQNALSKLYDKWKINYIRTAENINTESQKHIFVYAVLGYIAEKANKKKLDDFMFYTFIFPNDHLLPKNHKYKNRWFQLVTLCNYHFKQKPTLKTTLEPDEKTKVRISLAENVLFEYSAIDFKIAKKRAVKEALKAVAKQIEAKTFENPLYLENEKLRAEKLLREQQAQKEEKQIKHHERNASHSERMKEKEKLKREQAKEQERKRREAKKAAKEKTSRKGRNTIYREYTQEEIAAMSNSKRRNLQDRGIIPKGI